MPSGLRERVSRRKVIAVWGVTGALAAAAGGQFFGLWRGVDRRIERHLAACEAATNAGRLTAAAEHIRAIAACRAELPEDIPPDATGATVTDRLPVTRITLLLRCNDLPRTLFERACRAEDLDECRAALRLLVDERVAGHDLRFRYLLGLLHRRAGNWDSALAEFRKVAGEGVVDGWSGGYRERVDAEYMIAVCLLESGDWPRAESEFARLAQRYESDGDKSLTQKAPVTKDDEPDRPFQAGPFRRVCTRLVATRHILGDLVARRRVPAAADLADSAMLCLYSGHYTTAAELFDRNLQAAGVTPAGEPRPPAAARYFAAAAAARAGTAGDKDGIAESAVALWRPRALTWASEDYAACVKPTAEGIPLSLVSGAPLRWSVFYSQDFFLAAVRDRPAGPGPGWAFFWSDVSRLPERPSVSIYCAWTPI